MTGKMSRKKFIESEGATCQNWTWSWSFINRKDKVVIFGAWDKFKTGDRVVILDENWERNLRGRKLPGYRQAIEHIRLVESGGYSLKTFRMIYSEKRKDEEGIGPAKIKDFIRKLESKTLEKAGDKWLAVS